MAVAPVQELCRALTEAFQAEKERGYDINYHQPDESFQRLDERVRTALQRAFKAGGFEAFRCYLNFSDAHYTRNLVAGNDDYELMVLCWRKGQGSRVHNHADAHGYVMVLRGRVEETRYANPRAGLGDDSVPTSPREGPTVPPPLPGVLSAVMPCPELVVTAWGVAGPGSILYINDGMALHAIRCADDTDYEEGAVTLHLYVPPVRCVFLYEPEQDRVVQRVPGFFSRGGIRVKEG